MSGVSTTSNAGHAWVCDGTQRYKYLTEYFAEYRFGGNGNYYYSTHIGPSEYYPNIAESTMPTSR